MAVQRKRGIAPLDVARRAAKDARMDSQTSAAPPTTAEPRRETFVDGARSTYFESVGEPGARHFTYVAEHARRKLDERPGFPHVETGSVVFDGLFALSLEEVRENAVPEIRAHSFNNGLPIPLEAFETGEMWQYVWTRDISYAVDLGLASLDAPRCIRSLMYKTSGLKDAVKGGFAPQVLQDTGTGGSYPVSTDRVIWALAAGRVAHFLDGAERDAWVTACLPILTNTIEQDRRLVFDERSGLYRGEQSFLDWREQSYPLWTKDNVLAVATSEALSTNVAHLIILDTAERWLRRAGDLEKADRYDGWAHALRRAIRDQLYDPAAGTFATYRLNDLGGGVRAHQYDLLGLSLAILHGVATGDEAARALRHYPTGPFGPPVQWPQDPTVPIYHNHAIWPFVTAYWVRAARAVGNAQAFAAGVRSLMRGAALFLSNMENLDFGSGDIEGHAHGLSGPKINSRRQLWSVAGYVSMVQDAIFGLETGDGGIRFVPSLPAAVWRACFGDARTIALRNLTFCGRKIDVELTRPEGALADDAMLELARAEVNGDVVADHYVPAGKLAATNRWTIELRAAPASAEGVVTTVSAFEDARNYFGPPAPEWADPHGLPIEDGKVRLACKPAGDLEVRYNIYRDGECVALGHCGEAWCDAIDASGPPRAREYRVEAVFPESGNHSRLSPARHVLPDGLAPMRVAIHDHRPDAHDHALTIVAPAAGAYGLRVCYGNGNGTIDTGLTCALRRVDVTRDGAEIAGGYLTLPQTGSFDVLQHSSWLRVDLPAAGTYAVRIGEDEVSRNMSYFQHNAAYTDHAGGGPSPCNAASLRYLEVQPVGAVSSEG